MIRCLVFFFFGLFFFYNVADGQEVKLFNNQELKNTHTIFYSGAVKQNKIKEQGMAVLGSVTAPLTYIPQCTFKSNLPKGALFCHLEDAIYSRLNFRIKFRMGTDDRLSN